MKVDGKKAASGWPGSLRRLSAAWMSAVMVALVAIPDAGAEPSRSGQDDAMVDQSVTQAEARATQQPPAEAVIGTGVALVSIGETLLADAAADYVRQALERHGIAVLDGLAVPGVANVLESGGGVIDNLLRPYVRYLVFIRAEFTGERELFYMGGYDREYQSRLTLETRDLLDGRPIGPGVRSAVGYTQLSVETRVEDLLRPKFGPIAGELTE